MLPSPRALPCVLVAAALVALTACGAPPAPPAPVAADSAVAGAEHGGGHGSGHSEALGLYAVQSGPLGVVATDGDGHLLYRSDADSADPSTSTCTDACAQTWLPVVIPPGVEPELLGVDAALVGVVQRADGAAQLTLAGWPIYRHVDDTGGLLTAGMHGADGTWFAVTPTGEKASAP